jgi:hypothetical protein
LNASSTADLGAFDAIGGDHGTFRLDPEFLTAEAEIRFCHEQAYDTRPDDE